MSNLKHVNPETLSKPRGYTHVIKAKDTVYIAGQVGVAQDGTLVGGADPEAQVRQIWRNLEAAVNSVGGTLRDIVKTTTYITSIEYAAAVRKVRDELYQASDLPTSTLVVVTGLASPDYLVEIEAIALVE